MKEESGAKTGSGRVEEVRLRAAYRTPHLIEYGQLRALTPGGSAGKAELTQLGNPNRIRP